MRGANPLPPALKQALRSLGRRPFLSLILVVVMASGIGAVTAAFEILDSTVIRPLGLEDQDRLTLIWESLPALGADRSTVSIPNYLDWRDRSESHVALAAVRRSSGLLRSDERLDQLTVAEVGGDFFRVLPFPTAAGRLLAEEDGAETVVLSHSTWKSLFGGDEAVVGRTVTLDGRPRSVVGVLAPGTGFPRGTQLWVHRDFRAEEEERGNREVLVVGRLRPGAGLASAQAEMDSIAVELARQHPRSNHGAGIRVHSFRKDLAGETATSLFAIFGAVLLILLIVCINVSNILLVRATARRHEIAVHCALGADLHNLLRLLVIEVVVLLGAGWLLGIMLGVAFLRLWNRGSLGVLDPGLVVMSLVVSLLAGLVIVLLPLRRFLSFGRLNPLREDELTARGATAGSLRLQKALVAGQIVLALPLLTLGLALLDNLNRLQTVDLGFRTQGVLTLDVELGADAGLGGNRHVARLESSFERLRAVPGVVASGATSAVPMSGSSTGGSFSIVGRDAPPGSPPPSADLRVVWPGYLKTLSIPVIAGRGFTERDTTASTSVALVNETLARRFWPGENPVGQHLRVGHPEEVALYGRSVARQIVGVVADVVHHGVGQERRPEIYVPFSQSPLPFVSVVLRTPLDPEAVLPAARDTLAGGKDGLVVRRTRTLEEVVATALGHPELQTLLLLVLASVALVLLALSIYAVLSNFLLLRRHDIGIHMVVGADFWRIGQLTLRGTGAASAAALGGGLLLSWYTLKMMHQLFHQADPSRILPMLVALGLFALIATIATAAPLSRLLRLAPADLLRHG